MEKQIENVPMNWCWKVKTESTGKLSNFNFQRTQKPCTNSFLHFSRATDVISHLYTDITPKKKNSHGSPKKLMSNFTKLHLAHEIFRILPDCVLTILVKFDIHFLGPLREKFSLVLLQMTNCIFSRWKMLKRMQYTLNYSGSRFLSTEN